MPFKLFDYIDATMVSQENRDSRASKTPAVWPSEASANRLDKSESNIVGKCHRASFGRMVGWNITNKVDPVGAWRFVTGRLIEGYLTDVSKATNPKIYVASGVRHFVDDLFLPFELDLVVIDPDTKQGWITECKTYYGYMAKKEIETEGRPKLENLMQASLYLLELRTGAKLKEVIRAGLEAKSKDGPAYRNRIEANLEMLDQMDDGPLGCKLVYISRDECLRKEFNITIEEHFDGSFYPCVDGAMWQVFTVDSIYDRYKTLQNYWYAARAEATQRLEAKGIFPPPENSGTADEKRSEVSVPLMDDGAAAAKYLKSLEIETQALPEQFWPPAEYQWAYPADKIETLRNKGVIGKTRYDAYKAKKPGKDRIGDWQCLYCNFKKICVPKQNPNWAYQLYDIENATED